MIPLIFVYPIVASALCVPTGTSSQSEVLGHFAEVEDVSQATEIDINPANVDIVEKAGRTVNTRFWLDGSQPHYDYYYTASHNYGKIIAIRQIRNDVDSLIFMMKQLGKDANVGSYKTLDERNTVLGYVRSFSDNYTYSSNDEWTRVAGDIGRKFITAEDQVNSHGLSLYNYFRSFVKPSLYNSYDHRALNSGESWQISFLIDPLDHSHSIDLPHFFASLDGVYGDTGAALVSVGDISVGVTSQTSFVRDLVSWAGDLQQEANALQYLRDKNDDFPTDLSSFDFSQTLSRENGSFSYSDFSADLDSFSIAKGYLDVSSEAISDAMEDYYSHLEANPQNRFIEFLTNVPSDNWCECSNGSAGKFEKMAFNLLALNLKDDGTVEELASDIYSSVKFAIMKGYSGTHNPDKDIRYYLAKSFVVYVASNAGESLEISL